MIRYHQIVYFNYYSCFSVNNNITINIPYAGRYVQIARRYDRCTYICSQVLFNITIGFIVLSTEMEKWAICCIGTLNHVKTSAMQRILKFLVIINDNAKCSAHLNRHTYSTKKVHRSKSIIIVLTKSSFFNPL